MLEPGPEMAFNPRRVFSSRARVGLVRRASASHHVGRHGPGCIAEPESSGPRRPSPPPETDNERDQAILTSHTGMNSVVPCTLQSHMLCPDSGEISAVSRRAKFIGTWHVGGLTADRPTFRNGPRCSLQSGIARRFNTKACACARWAKVLSVAEIEGRKEGAELTYNQEPLSRWKTKYLG